MLAGWMLLAAGSLAKAPPTIYTLVHDKLSPAEQVLVQTLQGLANRKEAQIWLETGGIQALILEDLKKEGRKVVAAKDVWELVASSKKWLKWYVPFRLGDESLNVATSLSGWVSSVAVEESLVGQAKAHGLQEFPEFRTNKESSLFEFNKLFSSQGKPIFSPSIAIEQPVSKPGHLRDFAAKHGAFVMAADDREFRKRVVRGMGPSPLVFGWGKDEFEWISDISAAGGSGVAADWCINLSALEALPVAKLKLPASLQAPSSPPNSEDQVRYVAFVLSDGDNIQWLTGGFATDPKYYASSLRGSFPMTWEVSPLLSKFAPRVLQKIYDLAKTSDGFVTGAGLPGYVFPHLAPDRKALASASAPYLKDSGLRIISVLNRNEGSMEDVFPWLDLKEVAGAIYKDYAPYDRRKGELVWHNGKPCMAYRFILWEGLMGVDELAAEIERLPTSPKTDSKSYALVNVHAWSFNDIGGPIEAVRRVIAKLGPKTKVVTANELFRLLRANRRK